MGPRGRQRPHGRVRPTGSAELAALRVSFTGNDLSVTLATGATSLPTSTAAQVVAAINASPAFAKLVATTYRGNAGTGIVQPRTKGNLSDFLTTATNAHVQRGPFEYFVMRIGKNRPGNSADQGIHGRKVGVFLYCQQHAREWATPLTCLETAEQLLRNYGIDKTTGSSSTSSTSSSCRRRTRTERITRCTTSRSSGRT